MIRPMAKRKRSEHYVNNKEFLAALIKYREDKEIAAAKGLPKPPIPRYIGECFLKIANHLSFKPNFVNYMFKEDMVSDGIENCVQYIHNFNPEKSQNPLFPRLGAILSEMESTEQIKKVKHGEAQATGSKTTKSKRDMSPAYMKAMKKFAKAKPEAAKSTEKALAAARRLGGKK